MALLTWDYPGGKERVRDKGTSPYNSETCRNEAMRILNQINSAVTVRHQHGHKAGAAGMGRGGCLDFPWDEMHTLGLLKQRSPVLINPGGNCSEL